MSRPEYITDGIWARIRASVRKRPSRCQIAVAYFATHGAGLLPLTRGSILVVDASETTVGAGQTNPCELLKLIRRGVGVYSISNLHAKVFVVGDEAFVGSNNASGRSESLLVEAALRTDDRRVVSAVRRFVADLAVEPIGPEEAKRLCGLYRPPKLPLLPGARTRGTRKPGRVHGTLWIVRTRNLPWDEEDWSAHKKGLPHARRNLSDRRTFEVTDFAWMGSRLTGIARGHRIVRVDEEDNGSMFVNPAGTVVHVEPYAEGPSRIIFVEKPKGKRRRAIPIVLRDLTPKARRILRHSFGRRVPATLAHEILTACE